MTSQEYKTNSKKGFFDEQFTIDRSLIKFEIYFDKGHSLYNFIVRVLLLALNFNAIETRKLSFEEMEQIEGGWGAREWLSLGCISGGLALSMLSGPAFALTASLTIHACAGYFLTQAYM